MAYNAVVNPLFIVAPVVAELMPTAANLKSDYDRAQLRLLPPTPLTPINIVISEQYARIVINENAPTPSPVNFLMFNTSYSSDPGGPVDETILGFSTDEMFRNLCNCRTVYMDGTFCICPPQFYWGEGRGVFVNDDPCILF